MLEIRYGGLRDLQLCWLHARLQRGPEAERGTGVLAIGLLEVVFETAHPQWGDLHVARRDADVPRRLPLKRTRRLWCLCSLPSLQGKSAVQLGS